MLLLCIVLSNIVIISATHHVRILGNVELLAMVVAGTGSTMCAIAVNLISGEVVHLVVVVIRGFSRVMIVSMVLLVIMMRMVLWLWLLLLRVMYIGL